MKSDFDREEIYGRLLRKFGEIFPEQSQFHLVNFFGAVDEVCASIGIDRAEAFEIMGHYHKEQRISRTPKDRVLPFRSSGDAASNAPE